MKPAVVRCAIYTRKSSEEGLEQDFNSLDAQAEACAAYILSQASEGWTLLPERYDDGGISGGTLARPALQRLLTDVKAGKIDTIVVYKVDRLTRSLLDFSRLVEAFDASSTSFVSVTQSFNTTTSMGRLTLNMLLSFAQFEREVTAERIRDKIAASKARGMWMGGTPPLGYAPDGRSLSIVEEHAAVTRHIFQRYLALGNVRRLQQELIASGTAAPLRHTASGKPMGGRPFSRGQLYLMLKCVTYTGQIGHRGSVYPGQHAAIIEADTFARVQAMLADNTSGTRTPTRAASPSLLAGKIVDSAGEPLIATHASKGPARYRYYVSRSLHHGTHNSGLRVPAGELEAAVSQAMAQQLADPLTLAAAAGLHLPSDAHAAVVARAAERGAGPGLKRAVQAIVTTVRIQESRVEIDCATTALAAALQLTRDAATPETITLIAEVRLTRSGRVMRLVQASGAGVTPSASAALTRLLLKARGWWATLREGELDISTLAAREGVQPAYLTRVLRLAFLAPAATEAILAGKARPEVDVGMLTLRGTVEPLWTEQVARLLPGPNAHR